MMMIQVQDVLHKLVTTWLGKLLIGTLGVLTSLRYGGGLYAYLETEKLERPTYIVLRKLPGRVEIRRYDPYLIAETTVDNTTGFQEAGRKGFGVCAGYIFGKNRRKDSGTGFSPRRLSGWIGSATTRSSADVTNSEKMAMTAPVRLDGVGINDDDTGDDSSSSSRHKKKKKSTRVSFVIGSNYTLKTAPTPLESNKIKIRQVPAHTLAVKTFSGPPPKDDRVKTERRKLEATLVEANIDLPPSSGNNNNEESTLVYGYHDPFITPNLLRRNEVALVLEGSV